jgi:hypothetical protein
MTDIPKGFPATISDKELNAYIELLLKNNPGADDWTMLPLAHNERQNRAMRAATRTSRSIAQVALVIGVISLAVSLISTVSAAWYARRGAQSQTALLQALRNEAAQSSDRWEETKTALLQALRTEAAGVRQDLDKISREMAARRGSTRATSRH